MRAILNTRHSGRRARQRIGGISTGGFGDRVGSGKVRIPLGTNDATDKTASGSANESRLRNTIHDAAFRIVGNLGSHVAHGLFQGFLETFRNGTFNAASDHVLSADASSLRNQPFGKTFANAADGLLAVSQFAGNTQSAFRNGSDWRVQQKCL